VTKLNKTPTNYQSTTQSDPHNSLRLHLWNKTDFPETFTGTL